MNELNKVNNEFFNRELSWIEFNARVLFKACRKDIPLVERLNYLAIVSSNFSEFFMVRVAGLKHQQITNPEMTDIAGLTPDEQLKLISERVHQITELQSETLIKDIIPALSNAGIKYVNPSQYTLQQKVFTKTMFQEEIFPQLTPLRTNTEIFPYIANLRLHAAFKLKTLPNIEKTNNAFSMTETENPIAIVQIPSNMPRLVLLPSDSGEKNFTLIGDIITEYGAFLFPGYEVTESMLFNVTRDADFAVEEDASLDFIQAMEEVLEKRQSSVPVRLLCTKTSSFLRDFLKEKLKLQEDDIYSVEGIVEPATFLSIAEWPEVKSLKYEKWEHFKPNDLPVKEPLWNTLKQRDVLLHVPYQSYEPVISFINKAADDPNTVAIKMTLYRTSGNSPIVRALERAARNGKQVTVFVELKARFDEKRNISWATQLEKAGVIVVYGIVNLKVHAKILLVVRKENDGIHRYVQLSTGNFNDKTAKLYTDMSLFTSNEDIANDATLFFNVISGYSVIQPMKKLYMAPVNLKSKLLELIERETNLSTPENPGLIMIKANSLGHEEIIRALYKASQSGVKILLNIRGICMLVPGVQNQSENISVISIVDRYLEHTRIFYFQNTGSEELYLSSADIMPRNLDRRVELMFPVTQKDLFLQIKDVLQTYFKDNTHAHKLNSDGTWLPILAKDGETEIRAQEIFYLTHKKKSRIKNKEKPFEFIIRRKN